MTRTTIIASVAAVALAVGLVGLALKMTGEGVGAATLSATDAVGLASRYAQTPAPAGWMTSAPSQANAQLTTYGAAVQLKDGRALQGGTKLAQQSNRAVWLVFSRGDVTVPSETAPKSAPPAAQVYHQMSIILDANSGELLGATLYPPTHEVAQAATLPTVVLTAGTPMVVPAAPNRTVERALPTRSVPGRPAPQGTALPVQPVVPGATPTPAR